MMTVNIHEANTTFSRLVDRTHSGEEIVVAKAGRPWARLVPLEAPEERVPGRYTEEVPLISQHAVRAGTLPGAHRDPFDRMPAAQSIIEEIAVICIDGVLSALGASRIWE